MFENARFKLTIWYLIIIMTVSALFSVAIYSRVNMEFSRFERFQVRVREDIKEGIIPRNLAPQNPRFGRVDPLEIQRSRTRIILILIFLNLGILVFAGAAGYFLAGRTLKPIKEMVDEQNRFITDSSHELKTPLTSLRSEIEVALRNKKMSVTDTRKILESNLEEVLSLQILSDNLLELAENGSSRKNSDFKEISILSCVDAAIKKVENLAKEKQIKIENKIEDIKIKGVRDMLAEVFVILLDNAIKYSKKNGKVEIASKVSDKNIEVSVTDNGIGIESEDLPHIFDRFYRADKSRSFVSGYGLGLSIAKKIIESHNGKVEVSSILSKQTTFTVNLPV